MNGIAIRHFKMCCRSRYSARGSAVFPTVARMSSSTGEYGSRGPERIGLGRGAVTAPSIEALICMGVSSTNRVCTFRSRSTKFASTCIRRAMESVSRPALSFSSRSHLRIQTQNASNKSCTKNCFSSSNTSAARHVPRGFFPALLVGWMLMFRKPSSAPPDLGTSAVVKFSSAASSPEKYPGGSPVPESAPASGSGRTLARSSWASGTPRTAISNVAAHVFRRASMEKSFISGEFQTGVTTSSNSHRCSEGRIAATAS
mmetsp:Transcript_18003/g.44980  ORF Transcript_18003/g.44980 Transcript_18003/m.44980 type:complete len:258 (-) Transcript_18003:50-823(-)